MSETLDRESVASAEQACWLPPRRRSAGAARRLLRDFLVRHDSGEQYVEVGELLLGELVANAVEHAHVPPDRLIMVRFALTGAGLRIEVHDAGDRYPDTGPADRPPGLDEESGRGLWLVRQLSDCWGCHARTGAVGKAVWCTVAPVSSTARSAA
jgi:anti-sigma regulatory factor (Ser/Thr protein kinase)